MGEGPIGLFLGSLYPHKRLDYLMAAADEIAARLPAFRLVIAGDGPEREAVAAAASSRPHVLWTGYAEGERKAVLLKSAAVLLIPGAVGLVIVDGFVAGVPTITTSVSTHGPEVEYLSDGENGMLLPADASPTEYAEAALTALGNGSRHARGRSAGGNHLLDRDDGRAVRRRNRASTQCRAVGEEVSEITVLTTSWDDGTPEDLALGRLLARYGFRGTFYATTGPGGSRTIDEQGLRELVSLGHELGNHGRSHRPFTEISASEIDDEIDWGIDEISRFAQPPPVVAPPRGRFTRTIVDQLNARGLVVRSAPILGTRRTAPGVIVPTAQVYPHTIGRTYLHLVRRRSVPLIPFVAAWSRSRTVRGRLRRMIDTAGDHVSILHLWGHSRELEQLGLWADVELLLEQAAETGFEPATNGQIAQPPTVAR